MWPISFVFSIDRGPTHQADCCYCSAKDVFYSSTFVSFCQPLMQAGSLNDTRFYQIFYERYTSGYGTFHRVYKGVLQQNIARGTTDPGYKVCNLNYLLNFYHEVMQTFSIDSKLSHQLTPLALATKWCCLHRFKI